MYGWIWTFTDPFTAAAIAARHFHVVGNASEMVSKHKSSMCVYGRSQLGPLHSTWCEQAYSYRYGSPMGQSTMVQ